MLETQIKALNESIQANTAMLEKVLVALTSADVKSQVEAATHTSLSEKVEEVIKPDTKTKAKTVKANPIIELEPETTDIVADIVTANDLKQLAKDAIAEGVLRTDIKKLITDAGADTISALNDEQRTEVFNALTKLKGE